MRRKRDSQLVQAYSRRLRWDEKGQCFESVDDGPEKRNPGLDFGTQLADILVDPWIQDAIKVRS